ncbi:hypothetical protein [Catenulispora pinisilvae]|uniref:hypothetical protein n=1 Tax=Catenulispora pinisilvae TaxID=2705253 RepID=UPI0018918256|nr:hypothetical protein [Catenulispora pinisilvae]
MSVFGLWAVTAVADGPVRTWRERYADELAATARADGQAMAWWAGLGDDAFLERDEHDRWHLTEAGSDFADLFWESEPADLVPEVLAAAEAAGESGRCCPSARKGSPAAAFYQALGVADTVRMPGGLGTFLLTADETAAALPEVERILAETRREELIERVGLWLDHAANGSVAGAWEVVDGVVRVFREAAARQLGVAAVSVFY